MSNTKTSCEVQLRAAKIPFIGWLAVHYWFAIIEPEQTTRWEIWQTRNTGGKSWGHLHKNLMPFDRGVGNGASWLVTTWTGETAKNLTDLLENSPDIYPHNYCYRYVPGPNSNTYVRWILEQANLRCALGRKAIGQSYMHFAGQESGQRFGIHLGLGHQNILEKYCTITSCPLLNSAILNN